MNNDVATVMANKNLPLLVTPHLSRSSIASEFHDGGSLPDIIPNDKYALSADSVTTNPPPRETYNASTTVRHHTKEGGYTIVTGSRTIIDAILSWSTAQSTLLLLFECICIIFGK